MKYIFAIIITIFIILAIAQADKKYVLDELDFPIVAKATSESGSPIYYRGEGSEKHVGIYHPTLYINTLALFIKIFGFKENVVRSFGIICTLLTAWLAVLIYGQIVKDKTKINIFAALFFIIFLFNPYTLANSTLPDIDSTVLPVSINIFLFAILKLYRGKISETCCYSNNKIIFILSLIFALNLWAKLTTPMILPFFGVILLYLSGKKFTKSIIIMGSVFFIGAIIFFISYLFYCKILDLPFVYTFKFLYQSFAKGTSSSLTILEKIILNYKYNFIIIKWLTLPLIAIIMFSLNIAMFRKNDNEDKIIIAIGSLGLFVTFFYIGLISPFGGFFKYPFSTISLIFIFTTHMIINFLNINEKKVNYIIFISFLMSILLSYFVNYDYNIYIDAKNNINTSTFILSILNICLIISLLLIKRLEKYLKFSAIIFLSITIGNEFAISRAQAISKYPTKYHLGQRGFDETVSYLKSVTKKNDIIWSMKDIGYYVNNRYIENYEFFFSNKGVKSLEELMQSKKVKYYVVTRGIGQDRIDAYSKVKYVLDKYAKIDKFFGNFVIYRINDNE